MRDHHFVGENGAGKSTLLEGIAALAGYDEPESALSPSRQIEFLKLLRAMERSGICQVIMATHSPLLMAYPGARLLELTHAGLAPIRVRDTEHFRTLREFWRDPDGFVGDVLREDS